MLQRWRGSKGAVDPKTLRKWVRWLFLERISELCGRGGEVFCDVAPPVRNSPPGCLSRVLLHRADTGLCISTPRADWVPPTTWGRLTARNDDRWGPTFGIRPKGPVSERECPFVASREEYAGQVRSSPQRALGVDILTGGGSGSDPPDPTPRDKYTDTAIFKRRSRPVVSRARVSGRVGGRQTVTVGHAADKIKCPNNDCNPAENPRDAGGGGEVSS